MNSDSALLTLVGAAAVEAGVPLLSRDLRASDIYTAVGADPRLV